tara:strand:+ start:424 stop:1578 length:1155 start_codon:yes stop_codon:yes gene_type:complete
MSSDDRSLPGGYFGAFKYNRSKNTDSYIDPTQALAQKEEMVISFQYEPTGTNVFFKAFITAFNESYASDWVSETVFGRVDPIQHFKQTTRRISLAFVVPASTDSEAFENLGRVQSLTQFLYPMYAEVGTDTNITNALTLAQNPFVRLKVMNLARSIANDTVPSNNSTSAQYAQYSSTSDSNKGLLGTITSLNIAHNLENVDIGVIQKGSNTILPKMIEVNLDFTVVHESLLGWSAKTAAFQSPLFPYGVQLQESYDPATNVGDGALSADEQRELEQMKQNADERYLTAWGQARFKNDLTWLAQWDARENAYTAAMTNWAMDKATAKDLETIKSYNSYKRSAAYEGDLANYNYLVGTTRGAAARTAEAAGAYTRGQDHRYSDWVE